MRMMREDGKPGRTWAAATASAAVAAMLIVPGLILAQHADAVTAVTSAILAALASMLILRFDPLTRLRQRRRLDSD